MSDEHLTSAARRDADSLLELLVSTFGYRDRARWADALCRGEVEVDGCAVTTDRAVRRGQRIGVQPADLAKDEPAVEILWRDSHFVAIDKSPELVCIRLSAFPQRTFVRRLELELDSADPESHLEPAHRLDRGTSGVVVLAQGRAAFAAFQALLARRAVDKTYLAIVEGVFPHDELLVDEPIGLHPCGVIKAQRALLRDGATDARAATTRFVRVQSDGRRTLLRAHPVTGRTHQIRVHLAGSGFPLVGDLLYGSTAAEYRAYATALAHAERVDPTGVARHLLHAWRIEFEHPFGSARVAIEAPIPLDLRQALDTPIG